MPWMHTMTSDCSDNDDLDDDKHDDLWWQWRTMTAMTMNTMTSDSIDERWPPIALMHDGYAVELMKFGTHVMLCSLVVVTHSLVS